MLPFEPLQKNLKRLKQGGVNQLIKELLIEENKYIKDLNRDEQLFEKGIDSLGVKLKPYTSFTKKIKRSKGQPYDRTTLRDTESFHKKFYLEIDNEMFALNSADSKTDELEEKYGANIFGLTEESKNKLSQRLKGQLLNKIKRLL